MIQERFLRPTRGGTFGNAVRGTPGERVWAYISAWTSQQMYWERFMPRAAAAWFIGSSSSKGAVKERETYFLRPGFLLAAINIAKYYSIILPEE